MFFLLNLYFFDLHLLHWLVSLIIPAIILITSITYIFINRKLVKKSISALNSLSFDIDNIEGFNIKNIILFNNVFEDCEDSRLTDAWYKLTKESEELYQGKWLPDLSNQLRFEKIYPGAGKNSLSSRPAAAVFSCGLLCAVIAALLQQQIPVNNAQFAFGLIWIPPITGLASGIFLIAQSTTFAKILREELKDLCQSIGRHVPVFNDQTGIALMVDQMMHHDFEMKNTLNEFNSTVSRLAESDMAEGIRRSVEQVLLESVAPPIQKSAATLSDLAQELTKRQEQGMHQLATQFSQSLVENMQIYLGPVNQELTRMTSLMTDVKNYIDYAMKALETVREQSTTVLNDSRDAMHLVAQSREDLSDDFAVFSEQLRLLTQTSGKLAELQSGHETSLSETLEQLKNKLDQHSENLQNSLQESAKTLTLADNLTEQQKLTTMEILKQLQGQQADLTAISEGLHKQIDNFTSSSDQYVKQTLQSFDQGLAEFVERLSYTAVEIKDAVDALPGALRQSPDFNN